MSKVDEHTCALSRDYEIRIFSYILQAFHKND